MVKFVDQQLTQLRNEVYRMWTMVYNQMDQARQAVLGLDRNIAQQIWVRERLVDAQDIKIDTQVEDFIALYTPVAVDLRFVLAMLKINNDLERIGDYAYSIARFVKETTVQSLDAGLIEKLQLERMFAVVLEMMNERAGQAQGRFRQYPYGLCQGASGRAACGHGTRQHLPQA